MKIWGNLGTSSTIRFVWKMPGESVKKMDAKIHGRVA